MEKNKKKYTFRKFMNDIHLWLGIGCGIFLFIICLTGTIYVFSKEITEWVDGKKFSIEIPANATPLGLSQLITKLEKERSDSKVTNIQIPGDKDKAYLITLTPKDIIAKQEKEEKERQKNRTNDDRSGERNKEKFEDRKNLRIADQDVEQEGKKKKGEWNKKNKDGEAIIVASAEIEERNKENRASNGERNGERQRRGERNNEGGNKREGMNDRERIKTYLVNQYTGVIQGDAKTPTSRFFMTVLQLHRHLLIERSIGSMVVGICTILFILIEITGLILWLPNKLKNWVKWNSWKAGFKLKWDGNWKRINHDIHNTFGFYTFLLVTLMGLTGLYFSFDWFRKGLGDVLGVQSERRGGAKVFSTYQASTPLSLEEFVSKADSIFPYEGNLRITPMKDSVSSINVSKVHTGFIASAGSDKVYFDQYTGAIVKLEKFSDKKLNAQIMNSIYGLHTGDIFGTFTKILYFIACLIATSLPVTGTIIWINKKWNKGSKEPIDGATSDKSKKRNQSTTKKSVVIPSKVKVEV